MGKWHSIKIANSTLKKWQPKGEIHWKSLSEDFKKVLAFSEFYSASRIIQGDPSISWRTWVGLTWILTVPLFARFCLGWWEFG